MRRRHTDLRTAGRKPKPGNATVGSHANKGMLAGAAIQLRARAGLEKHFGMGSRVTMALMRLRR